MTEILVVDDDKILLKNMLRGIETISPAFSLLAAGNGLQALEMLKKHTIRLIVTDLKMPQMDGFELMAQVKETYPDIHVIVTTGQATPDAKIDALKIGALEVLFKPFSMEELRGTIRRSIEKQADGGTLCNVSPAMFVQLIDMERKTCTLRIHRQAEGQLGVLFAREGKLLDARMNDLQGKAAALEIFSWDHISLSIENDCPLHAPKIDQTLNGLILEASRLKDEREGAPCEGTDAVSAPALEDVAPPPDAEHENQMTALKKRLGELPELKAHLRGIDHDAHWNGLLGQVRQVGDLLNAGQLKAVGITTGGEEDFVVLPTDPPTVLKIEPECPKEKIYLLAE
jgi:CheY-like chemotaxis protein